MTKKIDMNEIDLKSNFNKLNINLANLEPNRNANKENNCAEDRKRITKQTDKEKNISSSAFGEIVPGKYELNCDAPLIPYQYDKIFNINKISNQENLGNIHNFIYSFGLMQMEKNSSYMRVSPPPHIIL